MPLDKHLLKNDLEAMFAVKHRGWTPEPRGRRTEKEVIVLPTGETVEDRPLVLPPKVWHQIVALAEKNGILWSMPDLPRHAAICFGKALERGRHEVTDPAVLDAIAKVIAICKEGRGLKFRVRLKM